MIVFFLTLSQPALTLMILSAVNRDLKNVHMKKEKKKKKIISKDIILSYHN